MFRCMYFKHKHMDSNHKIWGHHASKFGIIYSNGGHIGFDYTHTSLNTCLWLCDKSMCAVMYNIYNIYIYYSYALKIFKITKYLNYFFINNFQYIYHSFQWNLYPYRLVPSRIAIYELEVSKFWWFFLDNLSLKFIARKKMI